MDGLYLKTCLSPDYRPPQYRNVGFRPVSGLMSGNIPDLRLPMLLHSGMMQIVNSFTVAGAVLALF